MRVVLSTLAATFYKSWQGSGVGCGLGRASFRRFINLCEACSGAWCVRRRATKRADGHGIG